MIGLIFGETDFPKAILQNIRKKKIKYLIIIHELVDSAGRPTISKGNKWVCYDAYWLLE